MSRRIKLQLNRVEGDLEIELEIKNGIVTDARCIGTMYRGFEQILIGRAPMDALAITPRICGICSTAHLYASVLALESVSNIIPPANAIRVRNICLLSEEIQSDCRQTFLMFTPDLCHSNYSTLNDYQSIVAKFQDMKGTLYQDAIRFSRDIIQIVAIFGGQWPHSSYMVPGGVTSLPDRRKVINSLAQLQRYTQWFEQKVLGSSLADWSQITSLAELNNFTQSSDSAIALLHRFCRDMDLDSVGRGSEKMISYGSLIDPENPQERIRSGGTYNYKLKKHAPLDESKITEDITSSWYHDESQTARHPMQGLTQPKYDPDSEKYSWAKAPRYDDDVIQTGPLAQLAAAKDPLTLDMLAQNGSSTWTRQFARIHRQASSLIILNEQLSSLLECLDGPTMIHCPLEDGEGVGMIEAARGSLGHWLKIEDGKIKNFQVITPTAWNASPRDINQQPGHIEQSLIGLPMPDLDDPIEIGHVVRSHDPCLVCTVHLLGSGKKHRFGVT